MNRKLALIVFFAIFQISTQELASNIQSVRAGSKTWTVDDDGPADFHTIQEAINAAETGDTVLVRNGTYYENIIVNKTLTLVGENNAATIVDGNETEFIVSITYPNVTVRDFTLRNTNRINGTQGFGIIAHNVTNCTIERNMLNLNYYGIKLSSCINSKTVNNNITENRIGIILESSPNCTVKDNMVHNNLYRGILLNNSENCNIRSNHIATSNYGILAKNSNNCTITNNILQKTIDCGIQAYASHHSNVTNNTVSNNYHVGISIRNSMNCTVTNNTLEDNDNWYALEIHSSNNSRAIDNTINGNYHGIQLLQTNDCEVYDNEINGSTNGVYLGLVMNNKIRGNKITNNFYGLLFSSSNSCAINANTIEGSRYWSVWMYDSNRNLFFHNNFVDSVAQVLLYSSTNDWNASVEGNYWSDYSGADQNFDGVGDEAYVIKENNTDNHPLLGIFYNFKTLASSIYAICNSTISDFTYEPSISRIRFIVNGTDGTVGFCRICIPYALMNGTYYVTVDGVEPYLVNYTLYDDGEKRWIYFEYLHSPHEVVIVPEISYALLLPLFSLVMLLVMNKVLSRFKRLSHWR